MMNKEYFLITPKSYLPLFAFATDRAYFSNPVMVVPQYSTLDRLLWVTDPVRGETYPVKPENIKRGWNLTHRQVRQMAGGGL